MGIKEEITKIAVEQGYEGAKPKSIAQAIDALTDTLAGEDVKSGRSVVDAIRKYAPYVGSGGGGESERVKLFEETVTTEAGQFGSTAQLAYAGDIGGNTLAVTFDGVEYELPKTSGYGFGYGAPLGTGFATYPLFIGRLPYTNGWTLATENAGEHTVIAYQTMVALGSMQFMGLYDGDIGFAYAHVATTPFDISGDDENIMMRGFDNNTNIASFDMNNSGNNLTTLVPGGSYVVVRVGSMPSAPISDLSLTVDNEPVTDGYEVRQLNDIFYLTTQVPQGPAQHALRVVVTPAS